CANRPVLEFYYIDYW
nr:immunoglobulin heavy chain junction region [Macaca mulatta]